MKKDNIILTISLFSPLFFLGCIVTYFFLSPEPFNKNEYYKSLLFNGNVQKIYKKHEFKGQKLIIGINNQEYYFPYKDANKFIQIGNSIIKNKEEISLYIYRNKILVKTLVPE